MINTRNIVVVLFASTSYCDFGCVNVTNTAIATDINEATKKVFIFLLIIIILIPLKRTSQSHEYVS